MRQPLRAASRIPWREVLVALGMPAPTGADPLLTGVTTDSRDVTVGDLFVPLSVGRVDGHGYLPAALSAGAAALITERAPRPDPVVPWCQVPNTLLALQQVAAHWRKRCAWPLVAVTGSNGKTGTKEMLAAVLAAHTGDEAQVLATPGNFNNHLGLSLTLLGGLSDQRYAVVELGMNAPGEIARLTDIAAPDVGIITNASEAHLGAFENVAGVARAKAELWDRLGPKATAVVPADEAHLGALAVKSPAGRQLTFGWARVADVQIARAEPGEGGLAVSLEVGHESLEVILPQRGRHHALNAAAATAAALALDIPMEAVCAGLGRTRSLPHRDALIELGGITVLDDCYNANPASVRAAADTLAGLPGSGRLGAVVGDMRELGPQSPQLHRRLGAALAAKGLTRVIGVGERALEIVAGAREAGVEQAQHAPDAEAAVPLALALFGPGDRVLVKGSRAVALERFIAGWQAQRPEVN